MDSLYIGDVQRERVTFQRAKNSGLKTSLIGKWEEGVGFQESRGEGDGLSHSLWCGVHFWAALLDKRPPPTQLH